MFLFVWSGHFVCTFLRNREAGVCFTLFLIATGFANLLFIKGSVCCLEGGCSTDPCRAILFQCWPLSCNFIPELRAEVDIIEQMSSSSGSSSSDSESSSGSDDDSSSSGGEDNGPASPPQPSHQQPYNNRPAIANGTSRPQGSNQLMNTLSKCAFRFLAERRVACQVRDTPSVSLREESKNLEIFKAWERILTKIIWNRKE